MHGDYSNPHLRLRLNDLLASLDYLYRIRFGFGFGLCLGLGVCSGPSCCTSQPQTGGKRWTTLQLFSMCPLKTSSAHFAFQQNFSFRLRGTSVSIQASPTPSPSQGAAVWQMKADIYCLDANELQLTLLEDVRGRFVLKMFPSRFHADVRDVPRTFHLQCQSVETTSLIFRKVHTHKSHISEICHSVMEICQTSEAYQGESGRRIVSLQPVQSQSQGSQGFFKGTTLLPFCLCKTVCILTRIRKWAQLSPN